MKNNSVTLPHAGIHQEPCGHDSINAQRMDDANEVRVLRHQLQLALLRMAGPDAGIDGPAASHAEIAWVHDQVMSRPFMAQVVTRWFTQVRRATRAQVQALQEVASIIDAIESLATQRPVDDPRMLLAVSMRTIDQSVQEEAI